MRDLVPRYRPDPPGTHPPLLFPGYGSTVARAPLHAPADLPQRLTEITGPVLGEGWVTERDADLIIQHEGDPIGQRIVVSGRLLDGDGRPVPRALVEVWQANAGGRYRHTRDNWTSALDPNFSGVGRAITDADGWYRFTTIKPGAYPWRNHDNAWRPAHIHFSLFGRAFTQRLVTQMYFPDDPLFFQDPMLAAIPDPAARKRLVSRYDHTITVPEWALGFRFDIVLRGREDTPFESPDDEEDDA